MGFNWQKLEKLTQERVKDVKITPRMTEKAIRHIYFIHSKLHVIHVYIYTCICHKFKEQER